MCIRDSVTTATTYEEQKSTKTDIFSLLNSVIVYYADDKGAGSLLGCVDESGKCTITSSNSIWANIDTVSYTHLDVYKRQVK